MVIDEDVDGVTPTEMAKLTDRRMTKWTDMRRAHTHTRTPKHTSKVVLQHSYLIFPCSSKERCQRLTDREAAAGPSPLGRQYLYPLRSTSDGANYKRNLRIQ